MYLPRGVSEQRKFRECVGENGRTGSRRAPLQNSGFRRKYDDWKIDVVTTKLSGGVNKPTRKEKTHDKRDQLVRRPACGDFIHPGDEISKTRFLTRKASDDGHAKG